MKKILYLLMFVSLFVGCSENDADKEDFTTQTIDVNTDKVAFDVTGGAIDVTVNSSANWRVLGLKTWCLPSVEAGKNGDVVTFQAGRNLSEEERSQQFSFVCGRSVFKVTISQKGNNLLIIPQKDYKVSAAGEDISVKIKATVPIAYKISEEGKKWITDVTMTPPTADGAFSFLRFRFAANKSYGDKMATVKFTYGDGLEDLLTFKQPQNDAIIFDKDPSNIYEIDENGGEITVKVQANVDYTVEIPDGAEKWVTLKEPAPGSQTRALLDSEKTFTIAAAEDAARVAEIHFVSRNRKLDVVATIKQAGRPAPPLIIPDTKFRNWLSNNGYVLVVDGANCEITEKGLALTEFTLSRAELSDLTGIGAFVNLTKVDVNNNYIENLDLTGCKKLTMLKCYGNNLAKVIVDDEAPLEKLEIIGLRNPNYVTSNSLTIVGAKIREIDVSYNSSLSYIDVSECSGLGKIDCTKIKNPAVLVLKTGQSPEVLKNSSTTIQYK